MKASGTNVKTMREVGKIRLLVALDPAFPTGDVLEAARSVGEPGELHGLFVEDEALLRAAGVPGAKVLHASSASERNLEPATLERQWRGQATRMRRVFEEAATRLGLPHTFQVARGDVLDEIARCAREYDALIVGRARGLGPRSWYGRLIHPLAGRCPETVLFVRGTWRQGRCVLVLADGGEESSPQLVAARRIARAEQLSLRVLGAGPAPSRREAPIGAQELIAAALAEQARVLVIRKEHPLVSEETLEILLRRMACSILLTR